MHKPTAFLAVAVCSLFLSAVLAHEFWLQPDSFRPAVGAATPVRILIGDGLPGERKARDTKKIERFDIIGPAANAKPTPLDGKDGQEPAATFTPDKPGIHALIYRGKESIITLEADKFEAYLREDGLDNAIKLRAEAKETQSPGREAYSRCAKALLCVGADTAGAWNTRAGLTVEIIPTTNPYTHHAGDTITFTLLRDGAPVPDALMAAITLTNGKSERTTARTDAKGNASFVFISPGMWIINSVLMQRVDPQSGRTDVDWISVWSSLSFDLAPALTTPTAPAAATPSPAAPEPKP